MRNRLFLSASLISVALVGSVGAQSNGAMRDSKPMNHEMNSMDAMKTTYSGCVVSVNHDAHFVLTQVTENAAMKPAMKTQDSKMAAMNHDEMKHDEMKSDEMKSGEDMMVPATLALKTGSIDLRKHVGHKVSVTGSRVESEAGSMTPTFAVASLKVVSKSCR